MVKKRIKWDIKKVKKYFKDRNCKLLETEYINNKTKMRYKCSCGNSDCKICFSEFKRGQRCKICGHKRSASKQSHTYKFVYNYFKDHNCKLLETKYINETTKMKYICEYKHHSETTFNNFKAGKRCKKCSGCEKYTFDYVYNYFKEQECKLLETEYIGTDTPMKYICKCGNTKCKITFYHFKKGQRCIKCGGKEKLTFDFVKQYFEDRDCELLETKYINSRTKMRYRCECGNTKFKISFSHFKEGHRCKKCISKRTSGKNHWSYNPNLTDEERKKNRYRPGCNKWRKKIIERDKNTCQCCFQVGGKLIAHHIEDYSNNKGLGTVVSNGFLFCKRHHNLFHKRYGYNCNRGQLEEFLNSSILLS